MKEAFNYMLKDNRIREKAALYFGILFIANFCSICAQYISSSNNPSDMMLLKALLLSLAGFVISLITTGYCINCIKTIVEQKENIVLPFINFKNNIVTGFKLSVSIGMLIISAILVMVPLILINTPLTKLMVFAVFTIFTLFLIIYSIAFTYIFATTGMWSSFFRFKRATQMILQSKWQYWKNFLILLCIGILSGVLSGIIAPFTDKSFAGMVINTMLFAIIQSYIVFVTSYLTAKAIKTDA